MKDRTELEAEIENLCRENVELKADKQCLCHSCSNAKECFDEKQARLQGREETIAEIEKMCFKTIMCGETKRRIYFSMDGKQISEKLASMCEKKEVGKK